MKLVIQIACYLYILLLCIVPVYAQDVILKNGELFLSIESAGQIILTNTGGKVGEFILSPKKRYIAYSKIIGYVDEHNDLEDPKDIKQVPVHNIIIYDLTTKNIWAEISPPIDSCNFIYFKKWISENELLLLDADGVAVCSCYKYDVSKKQLIEIDYNEFEKKREGNILNKAP